MHAVVAGPVGQRATQRGRLHLLRACAGRSCAAGAVDDRRRRRTAARGSSPAGPGRCPSAGTASAPPPRDLAAGLGRVRALARGGELGHDDLVDQRDVGRHVEDLGGQLDLRRCRRRRRPDAARSRTGSLSGPLRGGADEHQAALGAGDRAPDQQQARARCRPCATVRPGVVWRSWPIRPAMRRPLNTRPGVAQAPIEPGRAVLALRAVAGAEAVEAVPLHDARGALALGRAGDVDAARPRRTRRRRAPGRPRSPRSSRCAARRGAGAG